MEIKEGLRLLILARLELARPVVLLSRLGVLLFNPEPYEFQENIFNHNQVFARFN